MKNILPILLLFACVLNLQAQHKTENVILITLDGYRWQELFTGAERRLITDKTFVYDSARIVNKFWNEDPEKRREMLMPFFWSTIKNGGQLYGNRTLGNMANVTNNQWFSYPGYSELLTGHADNERIHSNAKFDNPNTTVLEFLNNIKEFKGKVAAYTSWDVFPSIINSKRCGFPVNSGLTEVTLVPNSDEKLLNELMHEVPNPLGEIRLDAFTFHYGWEYAKKNKPRVLFLSFDETDDLAHIGRYDLYLESARNTDGMIERLWNWVQSTPGYKDKTTFIVTCDHGRGNQTKDAWRDHGADVTGADQIWMAVIGPDTPATGEQKGKGQIYQDQIAKTLAKFLGVDFSQKPTGDAIGSVMK